MLGQVLKRERGSRRVVFVVGRLQYRQAREVSFSHRTKQYVVAAEPKPEEGPMRDWDVVERIRHRSSVTCASDRSAQPGLRCRGLLLKHPQADADVYLRWRTT